MQQQIDSTDLTCVHPLNRSSRILLLVSNHSIVCSNFGVLSPRAVKDIDFAIAGSHWPVQRPGGNVVPFP